jgi:flavin reductase (DIM6/NTAB) family NADH-FMN oxidoreductase RutF
MIFQRGIKSDHIVGHSFAAVNCPEDVSEWDLSGLTPVPSDLVKPPRVGESAFCMECTLEFFHDVGLLLGIHKATALR